MAGASTDDIYAAMDWLVLRQDDIEKQLSARHLTQGGIAMFDLSSSWVEGAHCQLAAYGYSRYGKSRRPQIEYGLLTDHQAGRWRWRCSRATLNRPGFCGGSQSTGEWEDGSSTEVSGRAA